MGQNNDRSLENKQVIIVHGWSDEWKSMRLVGDPLADLGAKVFYVDYDSREDSANYQDFAEGLQRELAANKMLGDNQPPLNFITHSTGALVLRQWLCQYPADRKQVSNIVFLAPANFGSPLATVGSSLIGKIFKGQHGTEDDDFEVGKQILHGLEQLPTMSNP